MTKFKKIIISVFVILGIVAVIGAVFGIMNAKKKAAELCPEHKFVEGVCENCGKAEAEVTYRLDIATKDCAIKFFIGEEIQYTSFGAGTNGYSLSGVYDNQKVFVTSSFSDDTKVNVYKCTYTDKGEFTGVPVDEKTTLFSESRYNKELVYTLSVFTPTYEIQSNTDCLYIFEKV